MRANFFPPFSFLFYSHDSPSRKKSSRRRARAKNSLARLKLVSLAETGTSSRADAAEMFVKRIRIYIYIYASCTNGDGGWTDACRRCGRVRDKEGATSSRPGRMKTTGSLSPTDTAAFTCHAVSVGGHDIRLVQFSPLIICPRLVDRLSTTTASPPCDLRSQPVPPSPTRTTHVFRNNSALCVRAHACHDLDLFSLSTCAEPSPINIYIYAFELEQSWTNWI